MYLVSTCRNLLFILYSFNPKVYDTIEFECKEFNLSVDNVRSSPGAITSSLIILSDAFKYIFILNTFICLHIFNKKIDKSFIFSGLSSRKTPPL
ncbi:hypothetical protein A0H76_2824 [Hepatospora eriocheir]|uniref:Uncharacterized protein n=1 Tax=Hepatospora eriocheir TaxID=1081669 RepID=A0A1X0QLB9_9MICR|nr:hypothetical protein A0H76_2824 [Hepatospora eriocheir]